MIDDKWIINHLIVAAADDSCVDFILEQSHSKNHYHTIEVGPYTVEYF